MMPHVQDVVGGEQVQGDGLRAPDAARSGRAVCRNAIENRHERLNQGFPEVDQNGPRRRGCIRAGESKLDQAFPTVQDSWQRVLCRD